MPKNRPYVPIKIVRMLKIETGNKCSFPNCPHETGLEIHHIDGNPENNNIENLIYLCAVHHAQATKGDLDKGTFIMLKEFLMIPKLSVQSEIIDLTSRLELVQKAIDLLKKNNSYRTMVIGPLFIHPEWYADRRDSYVQIPNFDTIFYQYLLKSTRNRNHDIRIILTNGERYITKVNKYVKKNDRKKFQDDLIKSVYKIWGDSFSRGPDLCCINTGFSDINMIFDDNVITTYRPAPHIPTGGGTLYNNTEFVHRCRSRFDIIFDASSGGQQNEIKTLIKFIENLW